MKFVEKSLDEIYDLIAEEIIELVNRKNDCILGLATGSSPIGVYDRLIKAYQDGRVSFKNVKTFNLDEYVGLDSSNDQSYRYFMNHHLFDHIDINKDNTNFPSVDNYAVYDKMIEDAGGVDLQVLGIGSNGHIAFNEPGTPFESLTHVTKLAESTIKDNSRFFESIDEVPKEAISMGLSSILKSKRIVLIAGLNKSRIIGELKKEIITENIPASILNKHNNTTIYIEKAGN